MRTIQCFLVGLLLLFALPTAHAQDLTIGTPITSTLEVGGEDRWSFVAQDGQVLSFRITAQSADFDPVIAIEDARSGTRLIENDDFDYPESRDALIEAFSAPRTGQYNVVVRGYGESGGDYTLEVLPGYMQEALIADFSTSDWALIDTTEDEIATLEIDDQALELNLEGVGLRALALNDALDTSPYYAEVSIPSVSGARGWQVGLVFGYQDDADYHAILLNNTGLWRIIRRTQDADDVLRDWGTHPAIVPGQSTFRIGVLAYENGLDVFYNGQYIGTESSDNITTDGRIGLLVNTAEAVGSEVTTSVDALRVTTPLLVDDKPVFPQQLVSINSSYTVRELERRNIIPAGGTMILNIPESFTQNVVAGVSRFPLASESRFADFVFGATVSWRTMGDGLNGCGLVMRDAIDSDYYALAYVDSGGGYGLAARQANQFSDEIFSNSIPLTDNAYTLIVIAYGDVIHYFLEGFYVGSLDYPAQSGGIGEAVINFEAIDTACRFDNVWLWSLDD